MENNKGQIILFVGPTCAGKTVLIDALVKGHFPDSGVIISVTTRGIRPFEKDGVDYEFTSSEDFRRRIDEGEFYEWVQRPDGMYYGSSKKQVHDLMTKYGIVFGTLDIEGCHLVKKSEPEAFVVFLYPDNMADLEKRLRARGDLSEEKIQLRLSIAQEEMTHQDEFDAKLENVDGKFEDTVFRAKEMIFRKFPDLR